VGDRGARLAGEPAACPLIAVITDPAVIPAVAAGLPQMVPSVRVPELTGAIVVGTARLVLLVQQAGLLPDPLALALYSAFQLAGSEIGRLPPAGRAGSKG